MQQTTTTPATEEHQARFERYQDMHLRGTRFDVGSPVTYHGGVYFVLGMTRSGHAELITRARKSIISPVGWHEIKPIPRYELALSR
jgi:hypothetical protein